MSPLERRCRTLLRAYPRWYRRVRGEEMLATLLESSQPGRSWPSARDSRALGMGGLRVRAAQDQRLTTAANLRLAAQLGAALLLPVVIAGATGWYSYDKDRGDEARDNANRAADANQQ